MRRSISACGTSRKTSSHASPSPRSVRARSARRTRRALCQRDLERAEHSIAVAGMQRPRARRVALFEPFVEKLRGVNPRFAREPLAQRLVVLRREVDAPEQRANIKAGAPDDDRALSALEDIANRAPSHRLRNGRPNSVARDRETPTRWCGARDICSGVGAAVPIGIPR